MTSKLGDQIMDELMERPMTATELSVALCANWLDVAEALVHLKESDLVTPVGLRFSNQESTWSMKRTRRTA